MKNSRVILAAIGAVAIFGLAAFTMINNAWTINSGDAKITFDMPNGKHNGTISGLEATFDFDPAHPELAAIKATIQTKNLKADNEKLRSEEHTSELQSH